MKVWYKIAISSTKEIIEQELIIVDYIIEPQSKEYHAKGTTQWNSSIINYLDYT